MTDRNQTDMGYCTAEDVHNVFIIAKSELEGELVRTYGPSYPKYLMAILENAEQELKKRSKAHIDDVLRRNPAALKDPAREKAEAAAAQEHERSRQNYQERVARGRAQAFNDQNARGK